MVMTDTQIVTKYEVRCPVDAALRAHEGDVIAEDFALNEAKARATAEGGTVLDRPAVFTWKLSDWSTDVWVLQCVIDVGVPVDHPAVQDMPSG